MYPSKQQKHTAYRVFRKAATFDVAIAISRVESVFLAFT
jgi:hypothetical protein